MEKSDLQRFLRGHRLANERIAQERQERLRLMTPQQSSADFAAMDALWYSKPHAIEDSEIDSSHIQALLRVRKILAKAYVAQGDRPV